MRKINLQHLINPVYRKELKTGVRSMRLMLTILGYDILLAAIGLLTYYVIIQMNAMYGFDNSDIFAVYSVIVVLEFGLILFVIPALTSSAISGERERQTLEILLTTKLTTGQIIRGKLLSSISTLLLLVFSSLPVLALVFAIGGINIRDLIQILLISLVTAFYVGSFGLLFSAFFRKTTASTIFTYGLIIFLVLGTLAILGVLYILLENWQYNQYMSGVAGGNPPDTDLGMLVSVLMLNPAISFASMLSGQLGSFRDFQSFVQNIGTVPEFMLKNWFIISLLIQLAVGTLVLWKAGRLLNPLKRKTKVKKQK